MSHFLHSLTDIGAIGCLFVAAGYSLVAAAASISWTARAAPSASQSAQRPAVSILKPLCGLEPELYENLRSFCRQDYPDFQIIFGVRDPNDPALGVAERIVKEFPNLDIQIVVNPRLHGDNFKNSNLMNMLEVACHDILVIADSDAQVKPDYLTLVTAPLLSPQVGLVTCIYRSIPTPIIWSRLGAMYVNEWFMPSVLLAWMFGHENYASGQTLCLRRDTLDAIGGLRPIANHLADDYRLGEMVRALGLKIVLSKYEVQAQHHEPTLESLISHQLRWMRTLHILSPWSFRFIFLTFSIPLAFAGILLASLGPTSRPSLLEWILLSSTVVAQLVLHLVHRRRRDRPWQVDLALIPARDALLLWTWLRTFFVSRIKWRGSEFNVDSQGVMHRSA